MQEHIASNTVDFFQVDKDAASQCFHCESAATKLCFSTSANQELWGCTFGSRKLLTVVPEALLRGLARLDHHKEWTQKVRPSAEDHERYENPLASLKGGGAGTGFPEKAQRFP
jgi:hypothetical protein